ncbi:bifunctional nicotinamide mononucleotide adenylyltransferase/ADP-ribose pyrophosphatase [Thalassovita gelatinovora]|uniref:Bifunctional nicotinamide mononucleotide adenylyltransferase/ADP-ribose pyrophosphatase n=1 Tax=Thalassovita gelatinovora TaxID=53501 RepID=A0A0P1F9K0_THAGE|nr:NUDIX domain-containing protein [Thalassovita gelatinovora]CUH64765.1 bifunctional nicotinamide mononucleotide adenylyltransferase/ADP-ribose pyrophosphatase [Thalassovita gelatinovora]SEP92449.1 NUDIX domain-containing protein [Thalassovita gelatinovora]
MQVKSKPGRDDYLTLPGGKQEPGETLVQCVIRECAEEIGAIVKVGRLLHVAEVFRRKTEGRRHQIDIFFACTVPEDYVPRLGSHPDPAQIATAWVPLREAAKRLHPAYGPVLENAAAPVYLGVYDG